MTSMVLLFHKAERNGAGMCSQGDAAACMTQVHERFFAPAAGGNEQDVREHLQALRGAVLSGCHICFSRIIPQGDPMPEAHPLWQLAQQVGPCRTCQDLLSAMLCKSNIQALSGTCRHLDL